MRRVGLIDVDGLKPNLALMKISAYHKAQGDHVEFYQPLFYQPDICYAAKVFSFTPDNHFWPDCEIIKGGTGYDYSATLPPEIETMYPDYGLYGIDYAMGFTSRGCPRKCPYCVVPKKEGQFRATGDIYDFWRGQQYAMLLDNNLTADEAHFTKIIGQLIKHNIKADFTQGLDIRFVDEHKAKLLASARRWQTYWRFAFDDVSMERAVRAGIAVLTRFLRPYQLMFYVLIGYNSTEGEDLYRVNILRGLGVDVFVMPYNKHDTYQRRFARWVNHKAIFKSVEWDNYKTKNRRYSAMRIKGRTQTTFNCEEHVEKPRWIEKIDNIDEIAALINFNFSYPKGSPTMQKNLTIHQKFNAIAEEIQQGNRGLFRTQTDVFKAMLHIGAVWLYKICVKDKALISKSPAYKFFEAFAQQTEKHRVMVAIYEDLKARKAEIHYAYKNRMITKEEADMQIDELIDSVPADMKGRILQALDSNETAENVINYGSYAKNKYEAAQ